MKIALFILLMWTLPAFASHGLALHGEPLLPKDFAHFDYC